MKFRKTDIPEVLIVETNVFHDPRGYFYEAFNKEEWKKHGIDLNIAQTNISCSQKDVVRGLHFQNPPHAQGKLIRVITGGVLDVAVDIRKDAPTYGKYVAVELTEENRLGLWIPEGFAHGFRTLQDNTIFYYDCTSVYHRQSEGSIAWNDPDIGIDWGIDDPILSEKDRNAPLFKDFESRF